MTLTAGSRLGPYEVLSPLGSGGMGEVYKARDTRLERTVAIKVLPAHLSSSADVRQRFEREARTISQLSHPHICALYDVGHQDGTDYLVMELLEGQTLAERLAKGPLPLDQTLRCGIEIADALEKAHRQGIVHRDLKPGNVMLTSSGVKLLDFGLAKTIERSLDATGREQAAAGQRPMAKSAFTSLPTVAGSPGLTEEGTILGTFQYMAPEQLEGKDADARTDIFALGAVLYEMATGKKAFSGASRASLISSIMMSEPQPVSQAQPTSPSALDRVVAVCLAKEPEARWQTAHDVRLQLEWIARGGSPSGVSAVTASGRRPRRELLAWGIAGLALAAAALGWIRAAGRPEPATQAVRFSVAPPANAAFETVGGNVGLVTVSPDGLKLVFSAVGSDGKRQLWIRPLDSLAARPLPGTETGSYPFWSHDSRSVGFFGYGELRRVEIAGGPAITICPAPDGRGGTWSRDGVIVFAPGPFGPLYRVAAAGGAPEPATRIEPGDLVTTHRWPHFLPDGRHFLYFAGSHASTGLSNNTVVLASLDSSETKRLMGARSDAIYSSGHLLFAQGTTLLAQPFDPKRLVLTGEAFPVAEDVRYDDLLTRALFSVSETGTLAYHGGGSELSRLVWLDRTGKELGAVGAPGRYSRPRLSPDGGRMAVEVRDPGNDIWMHDLSRGLATRFTFDKAEDRTAVWTTDGGSLFFSRRNGAALEFYLKPVAASGAEKMIASIKVLGEVTDRSPDGRVIVLQTFGMGSNAAWDLSVLTVSDGRIVPLLSTAFSETGGTLSPDGRWIAYVSNESGRFEVYVQPFPGPGGRWQISD
ncbi:MAG TPA: protein kinase, partial [Thermoanaerobaculia bacterium]